MPSPKQDPSSLAKPAPKRNRLQQLPDSRAIIEMISTIMVYRFISLTRNEVEAMIGVTLQQTRVYQDAKAEGVTEGRQSEAQSMITRQLSRRFGTLSAEINEVLAKLPLEKLEDLGEALLDFQEIDDLMGWLAANS
jgi:predicted transposase YdaD